MSKWKLLIEALDQITSVVETNMDISFAEAEIIRDASDIIVNLFEKSVVPDDDYYEWKNGTTKKEPEYS